jgi:hypothetical protein
MPASAALVVVTGYLPPSSSSRGGYWLATRWLARFFRVTRHRGGAGVPAAMK